MLLSFLISIVISYTISCSAGQVVNDRSTMISVKQSAKTYLALGDSYTIGQSVPDSDRFPNQVVRMLSSFGKVITPPKIIAKTGWTTGNLLASLAANPQQSNYDLVSLLIGVNNQYQRKPIEDYRTEFTQLLTLAIQYSGNRKSHVIVLSIPDYGVTPFARNSDTARIAREIDEFNVVNKQIAMQMGVHYIEITSSTRQALFEPSLLAFDSLHPSGMEYRKWSELLAIKMNALLN